ncbi:MAG: LacI family DNA-binding transcriptional regulator, partial [Verrucomicrobiota bacterium]
EVGVAEVELVLSHVPVDGVIAVDAQDQIEAYRQTPAAGSIPIVSMGVNGSDKIDSVHVDLRAGTARLMRHLLDSGRRRIAHATFIQKGRLQSDRKLAYQAAMREAGLKPEFIYYPLSDQLRPVSRRLIQEYIQTHGCPEAIFCHSDDAALGIYRGLCDLKLRVPQDVLLAGCDGIEDVEYLENPLTTLVQPVGEMCETAWRFLMNRLDQPAMKRQSIILKSELAVRESTGGQSDGRKPS